MAYHGEKVTMAALVTAMASGVTAAKLIGEIRAALFEGRGRDHGLTMAPVPFLATEAPAFIAGQRRKTILGDNGEPVPHEVPSWTEEEAQETLETALAVFEASGELLNKLMMACKGANVPPDLGPDLGPNVGNV